MVQQKDKFSALRQRAEKLLNPSEVSILSDSISDSISEIRSTIHELYTYRIELELQNDELLSTQSQLQEVSQDYLDLYDFAPVAYVTLNDGGLILKANNRLATLLDATKQQILNQPFTNYVLACDQDILYLYRQTLVDHQKSSACELRLHKKNGQNFWVKCEAFFKNLPSEHETNLILTDITERKQAEEALQDLFSQQEIIREDERTRIEREIHDELGSMLSALKTDLGELHKQLPTDLSNGHEKCAAMNARLDVALQIVEKLRPS